MLPYVSKVNIHQDVAYVTLYLLLRMLEIGSKKKSLVKKICKNCIFGHNLKEKRLEFKWKLWIKRFLSSIKRVIVEKWNNLTFFLTVADQLLLTNAA